MSVGVLFDLANIIFNTTMYTKTIAWKSLSIATRFFILHFQNGRCFKNIMIKYYIVLSVLSNKCA